MISSFESLSWIFILIKPILIASCTDNPGKNHRKNSRTVHVKHHISAFSKKNLKFSQCAFTVLYFQRRLSVKHTEMVFGRVCYFVERSIPFLNGCLETQCGYLLLGEFSFLRKNFSLFLLKGFTFEQVLHDLFLRYFILSILFLLASLP